MHIHHNLLLAAIALAASLIIVPWLYPAIISTSMGAQASHAAQSSVPTVWPPAGSKLPLATFAGG